MHMTEVETHKARKAHRCEWCWQRIDEGTEYKRYRYYDGGEAATIKMHPECMEAMQEEAAHWGGDFEWTPGQERPKVGADETANYFLNPAARERLTVPVLPFSKITEMNAGMYRGEKVTRGKEQDAGHPPALGGATPTPTLHDDAAAKVGAGDTAG